MKLCIPSCVLLLKHAKRVTSALLHGCACVGPAYRFEAATACACTVHVRSHDIFASPGGIGVTWLSCPHLRLPSCALRTPTRSKAAIAYLLPIHEWPVLRLGNRMHLSSDGGVRCEQALTSSSHLHAAGSWSLSNGCTMHDRHHNFVSVLASICRELHSFLGRFLAGCSACACSTVNAPRAVMWFPSADALTDMRRMLHKI
jgi:hypothetical protein